MLPHSQPRFPHSAQAKRLQFKDTVLPHASLATASRDSGSKVSVTQHSQPTSGHNVSWVGPQCPPLLPLHGYIGCTPLKPLAYAADSHGQSDSAMRFSSPGVPSGSAASSASFTLVAGKDAPVLRMEIAVLLAKDAIDPVPPAKIKSGFYSPYFIVQKEGGGLWPIFDLRVLNRALYKLLFKMLAQLAFSRVFIPKIGSQQST